MKILEVIPIAKGVRQEKLSYFTSKDVSIGALVIVPVRGKDIPAIVSLASDAKESKSAIKKSDFSLKPIKSVVSENFLTPQFLSACKELAKYYISSVGSIIKDFTPEAVLKNGAKCFPNSKETKSPSLNGQMETTAILSPEKERLQYYKSVIREEFAKNKSVFFCSPTIADINELAPELQKGIEKYSFVLNGKLSAKKTIETWENIVNEKHPVLIIATKSFLSIPRNDIGAIIIDKENSSAYKNQKQPYVETVKSAQIISTNIGAKLILADEFLKSETFYRLQSGEISPSPANQTRIISDTEQLIVDMKEISEENKLTKKIFVAVSLHLKKLVADSLEKNEKLIIFSHRRGHGSLTMCSDCQKPLLCSRCEAPITFHKDETRGSSYLCHKCLSETVIPEKCPYCKSWRLEVFGIGIQTITEEIKKDFPDAKIIEMNSDTVSSDKQGKQMIDNFLSPGGAVLIGTEIIFSFINSPVNNVAVAAIDGLFAIPEFRINERIFYLLLKLKLLAKKTFLIQTRNPNHPVFGYLLKGNIAGFYKEELENRKQFQYPPFKLLIKITKENKNEKTLIEETEALEKILKEWNPAGYKAFIPKIKNLYRRHIILKLEPESWPENQPKLRQVLMSLSPAWKIDIGPENLL